MPHAWETELEPCFETGISAEQARRVLAAEEQDFLAGVMPAAKKFRERAFGNEISFCSIVNAKSGACVETCTFCAQSSAYRGAAAPVYALLSADQMLAKAQEAEHLGATEFSIVTSGRGMTKTKELDAVADAIVRIRQQTGLETCASLGLMTKEDLLRLKQAGMRHYHHNIETARSYFPQIVSSHSWEDEVETVKTAQALGFEVCCGGIFGMGESLEQRIEFIFQLKAIDPDSIPINFLNPRPGTPLADRHDLSPLDCLKIIAAMRLAMPRKDIFVCGGREVNMGTWQEKMFDAGASGTMLGNYLTTAGRDAAQDLQLIRELGLVPVSPHRRSRPGEATAAP